MAVIKEWLCGACRRTFEADFPVCPSCGATDPEVQRYFTSPPAFKGDHTKHTDKTLKTLTSEFGLTNFSNNQSTMHKPDYGDVFKPMSDLVGDPNAGSFSGQAGLIKQVAPHAAKAISKPLVVGREHGVQK